MTNVSERIDAKKGEIVEIPLEANVSAGYQWSFFIPKEQKSLLTLLEVKWEKTSGLVGAPLIQVFRLQTLEAGVTNVVFRYKRLWEEKTKKEIAISIHINR
jgi:predicted secreted protein